MGREERAETMDGMQTIRLDFLNRVVNVGTSSVIGKRSQQQDAIRADSFYDYAESGRIIAVLCDGMGGLNSGDRASALCSAMVYNRFHEMKDIPEIPFFFRSVIHESDDAVRIMKDDTGAVITGSGTTLATVVIDDNKLYWAGVGDSRVYIIRGEAILRVTKDHNYLMLLNEMVKRGEITQEEADRHPKKEALVSYIGVGGVRYIDMNVKGVELINGDYIVLCSDGLYRCLSDEEIRQTVYMNKDDAQMAADCLTNLANSKNLRNQDNTSVVVIGYQDSG